MKQVVSASRRTDIPAFHYDWLVERIMDGFVDVSNPFDFKKTYRVSLHPKEVHTIVFWSKDFRPLLDGAHHLKDFHCYFLFTLNDCPELEPNLPPIAERLGQARELAGRFGAERIGWRFDPIVVWNGGRKDNLGSFDRIAESLAELGVGRCITSFCHYYARVLRRMKAASFSWYEPSAEERVQIAGRLAESASTHDMELLSCCCDDLPAVPGIRKSSCVDGELLGKLRGEPASVARDSSQRRECGCTKSRDIGDYRMTCRHRCLYCYARRD